MKLVILKLGEVLARALFVLFCIYCLVPEQSGQFGILATLINLFAFAFGYERHVDIQRRFAASASELFDSVVAKSFGLYGFNYTLLLPLFLLGAILWSLLPPIVAAACVVIVVSEHISNKTYNLALVTPRYHNFLVITVLKNAINVVMVAYWVFFTEQLQLTDVIKLWAMTSLVGSGLILLMWLRINEVKQDTSEQLLSLWGSIKEQFKLSFNHFMIGMFALVSIQLDRIMAGSLLPFEQVGIFFRHVTLMGIIYQFFNIAFFNRILPHVYKNREVESVSQLRTRTRREYVKVVVFALSLFALFVAIYLSPLGFVYHKYQLQLSLLGIFLLSFLVRAAADLNGLVYNAKHKEKFLLRYQMAALAVGVVAFITLTLNFGMVGTVVAGTFGASTYYLLTLFNYRMFKGEVTGDTNLVN